MNQHTRFQTMQISVLRLPHDAYRWNLAVEYLKLRTRVFIEHMGWDLSSAEEMEFEQYDQLGRAAYIVAHEGEVVLGGARLLRCDHSLGGRSETVSYMIRDAHLGRIDLPTEMCWAEPTTAPTSWELTRLVSVDRDPATARSILNAANAYIKSQGGNECLFLGPPAFMRMARSFGYKPQALGPIVGNQDGRFLAFSCRVI
ncbi:acyl-homoserine-lactone synthase [Loktanella sp. IMCC34160]|uniref:acyl-homoserine-lactone synthase n=1 Tax=Loktanella sp. IMCC34160 TaxID=2510646 RepID=UPI0013EB73F2|nr:acyl-homoserine-lactone synthase [Loktanella sp. IMCC34160]